MVKNKASETASTTAAPKAQRLHMHDELRELLADLREEVKRLKEERLALRITAARAVESLIVAEKRLGHDAVWGGRPRLLVWLVLAAILSGLSGAALGLGLVVAFQRGWF
jgi:uncharacterized protein YdcH (DUF465 family)